MQRIAHFLIILFLFTAIDADAQRNSTYESLLRQSDQPSAWSDKIVIPRNDSTATAAVFFRLEYDFIPFLRKRPNITSPESGLEYFSPVRMGLEVFQGKHTQSRRTSTPSGVPVFRETWNDTVWVETFEDTRSRYDHVQGVIVTRLEPGEYHYQLQLTQGDTERERPSQIKPLNIPGLSELKKAELILAESIEREDDKLSANILNYGNNVLYGQNFDLLIRLPSASADGRKAGRSSGNTESVDGLYEITVHRMLDEKRRASDNAHFTATIDRDALFMAGEGTVKKADGKIRVELSTAAGGVRYAHVTVPNNEFENSSYQITVKDLSSDKKIGERTIRSQWVDMPVSLYNLDVAIDMLKFIADNSVVREIKSGSSANQERKFREFWAERDPTPETEFNELMAEYYSRIDHAYQNFTSLQTPGYDTDRGKAYILYGPPLDIERRLLPDQPTREVWEYPNRELIFEAISGLGEFKLISES